MQSNGSDTLLVTSINYQLFHCFSFYFFFVYVPRFTGELQLKIMMIFKHNSLSFTFSLNFTEQPKHWPGTSIRTEHSESRNRTERVLRQQHPFIGFSSFLVILLVRESRFSWILFRFVLCYQLREGLISGKNHVLWLCMCNFHSLPCSRREVNARSLVGLLCSTW